MKRIIPRTRKSNPLSPQAANKLQNLQQRFQGALTFLKKTPLAKQGTPISIAKLPWYLVIGPSSAGKTTLLAHSGIHYILAKQFKPEELIHMPSSEECDWWVTRDAVLVDVPGSYIATKQKTTRILSTIFWNELVNLIRKTPQQCQLNGVVITLNLPQLMKNPSDQQKTSFLQNITKCIQDLKLAFGEKLPFYFVITKCDLLPGFEEFFSESSTEELSQAWGIPISPHDPHERLTEITTRQFNALIKRLNSQLLSRLHQERNPHLRSAIKDFPLHVERLKQHILQLIDALSQTPFALKGIYLTSAIQSKPEEESPAYLTLSGGNTSQALSMMRAPTMPSRSHFVKQFILQGLRNSARENKPRQVHTTHNRIAYAACISIVITAAIVFGHDFKQSIERTYAIRNDLSNYEHFVPKSGEEMDKVLSALPLLDALQHAAGENNHQFNFLANILSFYSNKSLQAANNAYYKALQTIVIPEVKNYLEKYLSHTDDKNPDQIYSALKAYLMLNNPRLFQQNYIANALNQILPSPLTTQMLADLSMHIDAAIKKQSAITLNNGIISDARKQLTSIPAPELALLMLKEMDNNNLYSTLGLGTHQGNPAVFISDEILNRIPAMYTASKFDKIMDNEISAAATMALQGNEVLGDVPAHFNQPPMESLVTQVRNQYIAHYVDIWESLIANIQLYTPNNLSEIDAMLVNITSNTSPLIELLKTIKENTAFTPIYSASPKIFALNNLLDLANDHQQNPLLQIFMRMQELHTYLQKILSAPDVNKATFVATATRIQNTANDPLNEIHRLAEQNPLPMKNWFNTLAHLTWKYMLQDTAQHIENHWQNDILPLYNAEISHHYPFNQTATQEVNLQSFSHFFGQQGKLAEFAETYIKPFINDSEKEWNWRIVDNQHLPLSDTVLASLKYSNSLQRTFFPNGDNTLFVPFTLQPLTLDTGSKSVKLNINGQELFYQAKDKRSARTFAWPGPNKVNVTSLSFETQDRQPIHNHYSGDWAWFKLVNHSMLNMNNRKELIISLNSNNHSAKYILSTQGHMNPFLPLNLARFELPETLLQHEENAG